MPLHPTPRVGGSGSDTPTEPEPPTAPKVARMGSGAGASGGSGTRAKRPAETEAQASASETRAQPRGEAETRERRVQRARDPEARKQALADAVIEIVAEVGIGRTTHRAVAARAGLPLGATTYYFPTLDALIAAALQKAASDQEADLRIWADHLRDAPDLATALVDLVADYMSDRQKA